jgi:phosphoglycerate dehydrogenase-like enzyme
MDNVIVTPHCAGDTPYYMQRAMDIFTSEHKLYRQGNPPANRIDLDRKY